MFDVFVAEASTVLADRESHSVTAGSIICARVFGVKGFDGIATFYADWHRIYELGSPVPELCCECIHIVTLYEVVECVFRVVGRRAA
jgi:hypothetical protein